MKVDSDDHRKRTILGSAFSIVVHLLPQLSPFIQVEYVPYEALPA